MRKKEILMAIGLVMLFVLGIVGPVGADSAVVTGAAAEASGSGAAVNLNFVINIPSFIYFEVATVPAAADVVTFDPSVDNIRNGDTITATSGGVVDVVLIANAGAIDITESTGGALSNGVTGTISYDQIGTTDTGAGGITPPVLSDGADNSVSIPTTVGVVTSRATQWTYDYTNPATPPESGTYNGTVTYTAAVP